MYLLGFTTSFVEVIPSILYVEGGLEVRWSLYLNMNFEVGYKTKI